MATSKIFKKVPTTVPNRSGFNMSHNNFFSAPVGTLVPSMIDFLIPGDEIDLSSKLHVQLPPMATDFYGRIEAKEEAFFVPARILFGGWKDFYVNPVDNTTNPSNIDGQLAKYLIGADVSGSAPFNSPYATVYSNNYYLLDYERAGLLDAMEFFNGDLETFIANDTTYPGIKKSTSSLSPIGAGSLCDYLGFKVSPFSYTIPDSVFQNINNDILFTFGDLILPYVTDNAVAFANAMRNQMDNWYPLYSSSEERLRTLTYRDGADTISLTYNPVLNGRFNQDGTVSFMLNANNIAIYLNGNVLDNTNIRINNILPLLAYHKIYDDWYRAPMIQQSLFKRNVANQSASTSVANMPWITSGAQNKIYFLGEQLNFANGHNIFELHQRNWQKDYFTSATPEPQAGEAASVKFDIENESGEFTIASLRAANALQQWLEKNNIGGFRYGDMIYAQYGVYPSDAITDRAIYLGSSSIEVYNKSIYQQSGDGGTNTNNPFNAIGSKYSNPTGLGNGNYCNNYKVTEAGFVIKIFSLVPQAYYSTGVRRFFMHNDISDIAFPVLAGVGDQPIYGRELTDVYSGTGDETVFGYVQRYADYKFIDDQVHGLLRDGESLSSFALQRSFDRVPELGSEFLQIPKDYLDQVSATDYKLSQFGCWVNCYNDYRKSSTLPAYSIPTLEDMKGHTVLVDKGGNYIA